MNEDYYNKEVTDVTLRGEDIKRVWVKIDPTRTLMNTIIRTFDKEYIVPDEGNELYPALNDKDEFPSIKLMGKIRYRDLEKTKFVIIEEPEPEPGLEIKSFLDKYLDKYRELYEIASKEEKEQMEYILRHYKALFDRPIK